MYNAAFGPRLMHVAGRADRRAQLHAAAHVALNYLD
jgi:hypothetical protein